MPRKTPLSEEERGICNRLKTFRTLIGLSQAEFAQLVGLDARLYASYEYERSRLNYPSAWKILNAFRLLNPKWLATGQGIAFEIRFSHYPAPEGFGLRAPFSVVYALRLKREIEIAPSIWMMNPDGSAPPFELEPSIRGRKAAKDIFAWMLLDLIASQPDNQINAFSNALLRKIVSLANKFPAEPGGAKSARFASLLRAEAKLRIAAGENKSFPLLTHHSEKHTNESEMKPIPTLKEVLEAVKRATSERGQRVALARTFKISPASLSEWLRGESEPGGSITLRLWKWVTDPKRDH